MKNWIINTALIVILFILAINLNWRVKDKFLELKYDCLNANQEVSSKEKLSI